LLGRSADLELSQTDRISETDVTYLKLVFANAHRMYLMRLWVAYVYKLKMIRKKQARR
jgi:hypothetical protein